MTQATNEMASPSTALRWFLVPAAVITLFALVGLAVSAEARSQVEARVEQLLGAVAEGEFHETLNLAELWDLPVLFICENNGYAMGTAIGRYESQTDIRA